MIAVGLGSQAVGVRVPSFAIRKEGMGEGLLDDARKRYTRALAIQELLVGPEHPDLLPTLDSLALVCRDQGRLRAARELYGRALRILEAAIGPDHPSVARCRANLTDLSARQTAGATAVRDR